MITNEALKQRLLDCPGVLHVEVSGDGHHYQLVIVSDEFKGKTRVARQQWVYRELKEDITSGHLHALQMKTWTKDEWEKEHG